MTKVAEITRYNIDKYCCAECGSNLRLKIGCGDKSTFYYTECSQNKEHQGTMKRGDSTVKTLEELGEAGEQAIKLLQQERGVRKTMSEIDQSQRTALAKYENRTALTKIEIEDILVTLWPDAPAVAVKKALLLCDQYGWNPLAKHVSLVKFWNKETKTYDWEVLFGIKAKRLSAQNAARKHKITYGYMDFSPRAMTEEEQIKINGRVDNDNFWSLTWLKDSNGNNYYGYGFWPRSKSPYGTEKGNSIENMSRIHSESDALSKMFPGELPAPEQANMVDDEYLDKPIITEVKGELVEGEVVEDEPDEQVSEASEEPPKTSSPSKIENQLADLKAMEFQTTNKMFGFCGKEGIEVLAILKVLGKQSVKDVTLEDWPKIVDNLFKPKLEKEGQ